MDRATELLIEIAERAELEADRLKRAGEKQGQYRTIAMCARQAIKALKGPKDPWDPTSGGK